MRLERSESDRKQPRLAQCKNDQSIKRTAAEFQLQSKRSFTDESVSSRWPEDLDFSYYFSYYFNLFNPPREIAVLAGTLDR